MPSSYPQYYVGYSAELGFEDLQYDHSLLFGHEEEARHFGCVAKNSKLISSKGNVHMLCLVIQLCPTLCNPCGLKSARLLCPWGFSKQEYQSGLPWPPLGNLPNPEIKPRSPALQADSLPSEPPGKHYVKDKEQRGRAEE